MFIESMEKIRDLISDSEKFSPSCRGKLGTQELDVFQNKLEKQEFVVSVIGAMKSGKSSFTNALLGMDLMPNENQACTLTTTDILHNMHDHKLIKVFDNGQEQIMKGDNLASLFHDDVRESRNQELKEHFTYRVHHEIHALTCYPKTDVNFVLMDTPGLNEMDGLGVKKEVIEEVFRRALRRADRILYVLDVQYFKTEENQLILEKIRQFRPDLLSSIIFVLNKVDLLRNRDGELPQVLENVRNSLLSWGIQPNSIYPLSAKKALLGRLIEKGSGISVYEKEMAPFLPVLQLEIAGKMRTVQMSPQEAYLQLIQESGLLILEKEFFGDIYVQIDEQVVESAKRQLSAMVDKSVSTMNLEKMSLSALLQEKQAELKVLTKREEHLNQIMINKNKTEQEIIRLLQQARDKIKKEKSRTTFFPALPKEKALYSDYVYDTQEEAKQIGKDQFSGWFNQATDPLVHKMVSHYQSKLEYRENDQNFFYSLNQSLCRQLKRCNEVTDIHVKELDDIVLPRILDVIQLRPEPLNQLEKIKWNYETYVNQIKADSHTISRTESFLIFFTQTIRETYYRYNIAQATRQAKNFISSTLERTSKQLHNDYIIKKDMLFISKLEKDILAQFEPIQNKVKPLLNDVRGKIKTLEKECGKLNWEITYIESQLKEIIERTDITTERKKFLVLQRDARRLSKILKEVEPGTTVYLDEGAFELDQPVLIEKSLSIRGKGENKTNLYIKNEKISMSLLGKYVTIQGVSFLAQKASQVLKIQTEDVVLKYCSFSGRQGKGTAVRISNGSNGIVEQCQFLDFETAMLVETEYKFRIKKNKFIENKKFGVLARGSAQPMIFENEFSTNEVGVGLFGKVGGSVESNQFIGGTDGIWAGEEARIKINNNLFRQNRKNGIYLIDKISGDVKGNTCIQNSYGIQCSGSSQIKLEANVCVENYQAGIYLLDNTSITASKNKCNKNGGGFQSEGSAKVVLVENECRENEQFGMRFTNHVSGEVIKNQLEQNKKAGIAVIDHSRLSFKENYCSLNDVGMQINGHVVAVLEKNLYECNRNDGISIGGESAVEVKGNSCTQNGNGIVVFQQAAVQLKDNLCTDNKWKGIAFYQRASGQVIHNDCSRSGEFAVYLDKVLSVRLQENKGKGNLEFIWKWQHLTNKGRKFFSNLKIKVSRKGAMVYEHRTNTTITY